MAWIEVHRKRKGLSYKLKQEIIKRDKGICQICGKRISLKYDFKARRRHPSVQYRFDHIIPFADGGSCDKSNLRLTCSPCNYARNKKGAI